MTKKTNKIVVKTPYLSETISELPPGIINKTGTGIGATTMELESKRNSIIVEPLKVIASSKAEKHGALYVGSPIGSSKKKVDKKNIQNYINDTSIEFKKIIVVADSLLKVMDAIPEESHKDYFLMIDECDSFQLDATFRRSMETCYELYKDHPKDKRCMISATPLTFSDPDLEDENYTIIKREHPSTREINLIYSENLMSTAIDKVLEIANKFPDEKIVVAYNNVSELYNLANELEKTYSIPTKDISVLCSGSSEEKVKKYYTELQSTYYPSKIVLKTSAYFTGYDIDEKYHLITLVENRDRLNCFSEFRLKQIAGRARKGLYSENIVLEYHHEKIEKIDFDDLIDSAKMEIKGLECLASAYRKNKNLSSQIDDVRNLVISKTNNFGFNLVKNNNNEPEISYLNIDALLELNRIKNEVFKDQRTLYDKLIDQGNFVTEYFSTSKTKVEKIENKAYVIAREDRIINTLDNWSKYSAIDNITSAKDSIEKLVYESFNKLSNYVENDSLKKQLIKLSSNRKRTLLEKFVYCAKLTIMEDNSLYKQALKSQFEIGEYYTNAEIHKRINQVLIKCGTGLTTPNEMKSVSLFNLFVKSTRNNKRSGNPKLVKNFNPKGIKQINTKSEFPEMKEVLSEMIDMF
jgi:hypothetical protein